ncbi:2-octaprenyl-6-methoxyphenyl hydroxylase [Enterovibrio nigricans]|uniref:2-octaprenyl-6-methoxyphenol hydroxylase n=1 Tax=Enterovibrio nigricans DSM 22720 TaxID=1121868 RepID=A0A1T4TZS0_9GAMM|nr:2-octaprenyl-6-methoxyphenyl hydroxylase [Enterovibrio nigricans]PKF51667.1 2-octaprenyl-6-methoxyphenyl hydroxylase [Enterovibrio nigricans]SKA45749.1 2-octaprenyl-6-methoxyphenol hydroxylase [Enterovibrio nigricans DSM 22720]
MDANAPSMQEFDVVIAGGAMAGATLALAIETLTQGGLSIAVVEAAIPDHSHPGYDARSIALSYGSCQLLASLGLWKKLSPLATTIDHIHVSDRGHFGLTEMHAKEEGVESLGSVIELADAGRVFHSALTESQAITMFCPAFVTDIHRQRDDVTLTLNDNTKIKTKLVVAADGATSSCCQMIGIERHEHDFRQAALIANVTPSIPHQGKAFERFTETGPIALLPMSEGRCSLVWCVKPDDAAALLALSDSAFIDALQRAFGWRLGKLLHAGERSSYPLILRQATQLISHRFAVVGNAAQTLHPIAGQGFNLGLRDVATLAEEIAIAHQSGIDIGGMPLLQQYLERREPDRDATVAMTSGLVHGFSNTSAPLILGRNLGLAAMSVCRELKAPLLQRAMGLVER